MGVKKTSYYPELFRFNKFSLIQERNSIDPESEASANEEQNKAETKNPILAKKKFVFWPISLFCFSPENLFPGKWKGSDKIAETRDFRPRNKIDRNKTNLI